MSDFKTCSIPLVVAGIAVALTACGGGGGGGGGGGAAPAAADPVAVTAANAPTVAGNAYEAGAGLEGSGSSGVGVLTGAVVQTSTPRIDAVGAIVDTLKSIQPAVTNTPQQVVTGAVLTDTLPCTNGGSAGFTLNDINNDFELSTGETASVSFNSCNEGGFVMNGSISTSNVVITGNPDIPLSAYTLQMTLRATGFTATENGETVGLSGNITLNESTTDGINLTSSISGTSLTLTDSGESLQLNDFQINSTENENTGDYTLDVNATVSNSTMGGSVTIVTDVVFQGNGFGNPSVGEATITGANNTSVRLIAVDSVNVTLEVDNNGDNVVDATINTTWDAL